MREENASILNVLSNVKDYQYIQLMRVLEHFHHDGQYRFISDAKLSFAASDINTLNVQTNEISFNFMGLCGVDSPLPHYFLNETIQSNDSADVIRAVLNIFNHRLYQLFYFSLKIHQPLMLLEQNQNTYLNYLIAMSGNLLTYKDKNEFSFANLLGQRIKCADSLAYLLSQYLNCSVQIEQNISRWVCMDKNNALADDFNLGNNSVLGHRIHDVNSMILIKIKMLSLERALCLLPFKPQGIRLAHLIRRYLDPHLQFKIQLRIKPDSSQILSLGASAIFLGWQSWVGEISSINNAVIMY